jgi:hypothetical protein
VIVFLEGLDGLDFLVAEVIVLELFHLIFLILHPQYALSVKVKGNGHFWHSELPMELDLILVGIDFVHVLVLDLELNG